MLDEQGESGEIGWENESLHSLPPFKTDIETIRLGQHRTVPRAQPVSRWINPVGRLYSTFRTFEVPVSRDFES
jgi:hypothetical protein